MSRAAWFMAGAGAAAYTMFKGRRAAEMLTARGARDQLEGLRAGFDLFRSEYAAGAAEAEEALRVRLALHPDGQSHLPLPSSSPTE